MSTLLLSSQAYSNGPLQALSTQLALSAKIEIQMIDRILESATTLSPLAYSTIVLLLPAASVTSALLTTLEASLAVGGTLEIKGEQDSNFLIELAMIGLIVKQTPSESLIATKSAPAAPILLSIKRPLESTSSSALPLRTSKANKASLWAFTAAPNGSTPKTIDESTLLTDEDLARPTLIKREDCDVKKTRKACKDCSCGLREILLDEAEQDDLVQAGFKPIMKGVDNGKGERKISSGVATSSCGSCYLGDAFRCGSCPYLGLPAFEPGQKVTIGLDMDDI